jgi:predicted transcriptional regulator
MLEHDHHLLPVVDDHQVLIGVVTRRDLLRRFQADDAYIAAEIADVLANSRQSPDIRDVHVSVLGGIVNVRGTAERVEDIAVVQHVIARVSGVLAIRSDLAVRDHPGVTTRSESPGWRSRRTGAGTR